MLDFQRRLLYDLKRQYGQAVDLYEQQVGNPDLRSGKLNTSQAVHHINTAIVVPMKFFTKGLYGAALLKAGRQFAYGAFLNIDIRVVVIDRADLPASVNIDLAKHVVIKGNRYEIDSFEELADDLGYVLTAKRVTGVAPNRVNDPSLSQALRITQTATFILN